MSHAAPLSPRKTPRQSRSRASYEAVLTAAAQILEREGMAGLNTNAVAGRAGVSIGTLYQYFPGKEAIAAELVRRIKAQLLDDPVALEACGHTFCRKCLAATLASRFSKCPMCRMRQQVTGSM